MTLLYYLNISCGIILVDFVWLLEKASTEKILKIATLLKIRSIGYLRHKLNEFVSISLYFPDIDSTNRLAYAYIYRELNIVEGLKANLLVGKDILAMERIIIDLVNKSTSISGCPMTISIAVRPKSHLVERKVLINRLFIIPPKS